LFDVGRRAQLGWHAKAPLEKEVKLTYEAYLSSNAGQITE
jgi:hypothetical protein